MHALAPHAAFRRKASTAGNTPLRVVPASALWCVGVRRAPVSYWSLD